MTDSASSERFARPGGDGGAGVAGLEGEGAGLTKLVVLRACLEQVEVRDLIGCAGVRVDQRTSEFGAAEQQVRLGHIILKPTLTRMPSTMVL